MRNEKKRINKVSNRHHSAALNRLTARESYQGNEKIFSTKKKKTYTKTVHPIVCASRFRGMIRPLCWLVLCIRLAVTQTVSHGWKLGGVTLHFKTSERQKLLNESPAFPGQSKRVCVKLAQPATYSSVAALQTANTTQCKLLFPGSGLPNTGTHPGSLRRNISDA